MADSGLSKFCAFLLSLVRAENDFALTPFQYKLAKRNPTLKK
jgi:hypothetical protein